MTNEELDEARAKEALRIWTAEDGVSHAVVAARLAREGWTPPEPVDPDILAFREWCKSALYSAADDSMTAQAYLAGARMAREREQERAKVLVEYAKEHAPFTHRAPAKYRGEA
jgi:hypothetical protein